MAADWWIALPEGEVAQYVGRQACAECHPRETRLWTGSDHQRAMDPATPQTVLGDFAGRQLDHFGVKSRMFRRADGTFCIRTDNREGKGEVFPIKYVLGYRPLQQYLVEFPDGRIQCLPIAWDTRRKRWFHLYPDEPIPHTDPLHWTRPLQNFNYMCAECHTTNLRKNYRVEDNTYHTEFSEACVNCEACHGPGSLHVKLARRRSLFWDRRYGYGLAKLKDPDNRVQVETCAPCHARRRIVAAGARPGDKLLDHYLPELLDADLYYPDGQILDEVYVYGSFVQSKMYRKGVRCTDCHDPHTTMVKFATPGDRGKFHDNRLCAQCHLPTKYDTPAHHHHPDASKPGSHCVECHMPDRFYMVVDPRRDHSLRIPRPDLTVALGAPNACNGCHHDAAKGETPQWAAAKVEAWYGKKKGPPHFAYALDAGRKGKPEAIDALQAVIDRPDTPAIVRATAVALLGTYPDERARKAVLATVDNPDGMVRAAAVRAMESLPPDQLPQHLVHRLSDPLRAVRIEAARLLARVLPIQLGEEDQARFKSALNEYIAGQMAVADQPGSHLNMGVLLSNLGRLDRAKQEYRIALRIDPHFVPARINLAMLYDQEQDKVKAEQQFRAAIGELKQQLADVGCVLRTHAKGQGGAPGTPPPPPGHPAARVRAEHAPYVPVFAAKAIAVQRPLEQLAGQLRQQLGETYYSLGLLVAENDKRLGEAAEALGLAAKLLPANARVRYNLGLACQKAGRAKPAEEALLAACKLAPGEPDYLQALAIYYIQRSDWGKARTCAEQLLRLAPASAECRALLEVVRRQGTK